MNLIEMPKTNLADISTQLRRLADRIDAMEIEIETVTVIVEPSDEPLQISSYGKIQDSVRVIGILFAAASSMSP